MPPASSENPVTSVRDLFERWNGKMTSAVVIDGDRFVVDCDALRATLARCADRDVVLGEHSLSPLHSARHPGRKNTPELFSSEKNVEITTGSTLDIQTPQADHPFGKYCRVVIGAVNALRKLQQSFDGTIYVATESPSAFAAAVRCRGECNKNKDCVLTAITDATDEANCDVCQPYAKLADSAVRKGRFTVYTLKPANIEGREAANVRATGMESDDVRDESATLILSPSEEFVRNFKEECNKTASPYYTDEATSALPKTWDEIKIEELTQKKNRDTIATKDLRKDHPQINTIVESSSGNPGNLSSRLNPLPTIEYAMKVAPLTALPATPELPLWRRWVRLADPIVYKGVVVHGAGRGARMMGCPTANISPNTPVSRAQLPLPGCYMGFVRLHNEPRIYPAVLSAGFNPHFANEEITVECHLLEEFADDFYGADICLVVSGFLRPESCFGSFAHLIRAIQLDCDVSTVVLRNDLADEKIMKKYVEHFELWKS